MNSFEYFVVFLDAVHRSLMKMGAVLILLLLAIGFAVAYPEVIKIIVVILCVVALLFWVAIVNNKGRLEAKDDASPNTSAKTAVSADNKHWTGSNDDPFDDCDPARIEGRILRSDQDSETVRINLEIEVDPGFLEKLLQGLQGDTGTKREDPGTNSR